MHVVIVVIVILQPVLGCEQECTVFAIKVARKGNNQEFLVVLSPILRLPLEQNICRRNSSFCPSSFWKNIWTNINREQLNHLGHI